MESILWSAGKARIIRANFVYTGKIYLLSILHFFLFGFISAFKILSHISRLVSLGQEENCHIRNVTMNVAVNLRAPADAARPIMITALPWTDGHLVPDQVATTRPQTP